MILDDLKTEITAIVVDLRTMSDNARDVMNGAAAAADNLNQRLAALRNWIMANAPELVKIVMDDDEAQAAKVTDLQTQLEAANKQLSDEAPRVLSQADLDRLQARADAIAAAATNTANAPPVVPA